METKYIIIKTKDGHLRHFKSQWLHHCTIARGNGYSSNDIVECGLFLDNELFILESTSEQHLLKKKERYIGNRLNFYQDVRLERWLKGRDLESNLYYSKQTIGLREGD